MGITQFLKERKYVIDITAIILAAIAVMFHKKVTSPLIYETAFLISFIILLICLLLLIVFLKIRKNDYRLLLFRLFYICFLSIESLFYLNYSFRSNETNNVTAVLEKIVEKNNSYLKLNFKIKNKLYNIVLPKNKFRCPLIGNEFIKLKVEKGWLFGSIVEEVYCDSASARL